MNLTISEMDEINFLLTDVSIELLGNSYFDIYGQQMHSLAKLCTAVSIKSPTYNENVCGLVKALKINENTFSNTSNNTDHINVAPNTVGMGGSKKPPARRASIQNEPGSQQLPNRSGAGPIRKRRKTIFIDRPYNRPQPEKSSIAGRSTAFRNSVDPSNLLKPSSSIKPSTSTMKSPTKPDNVTINEDIRRIQKELHSEKEKMTIRSDRGKHNYFIRRKGRMETDYMDVYDIVNEYYYAERDQMLLESNVLMEFIKFVKRDPQNANRMKDISSNILIAKNLL